MNRPILAANWKMNNGPTMAREFMKAFVDRGTIAGSVTLVARHGAIAALDAVGYTDIETRQPLKTDAIFQLHSMTKPVVAIAAMMLVEQGKLALTDPVEKHLPEFRSMWMIESRDGDSRRTLRRPSRPSQSRSCALRRSLRSFLLKPLSRP